MTAIYTTTHAGKTEGRKSAGHTEQQYFFAVWARKDKCQYWDGEWHCQCYASRLDLAQARAREYAKIGCDVEIVPVTAVIKLTKKQQIWAATEGLPPQERLAEYHARLKA
jgi:hypothetical protein